MEWSRAAVALALPFALWLLTFIVLAVQVLFLLFFETRVASGIIDRRLSDYALAFFASVATVQYDKEIAIPALASLYPKSIHEEAVRIITIFLVGMTILSTGVAFHYSVSHVTKFKGRSLLVFPPAIYKKDPAAVRQLWIKIFNLITLTSMVLVSLLYVYVYTFTLIVGRTGVDATVIVPYLAGLGAIVLAAQPLRNLILRFPSQLVLVAKLNQIITHSAKPSDVRRSLSARKSDPIGWARGELIHVARMLDRLARREDSIFDANLSHPVAAVYRAVADSIRQYCTSPKSLEGSVPSTLITTLKAVEGFVITGDGSWRRQLIKQLKVFEDDGTPRALKTAAFAGNTTRAIRTAARQMDRTLAWLQNRWQAIVIVLAIVLVITGALDFKSIPGLTAK